MITKLFLISENATDAIPTNITTMLAALCAGAGLLLIALLYRKLRSVSCDEVTGFPTFARFKQKAAKILRHAEKNEYMILSLDINDFRFINGSLGFATGNTILREIADHFSKECPEDLICRFYADNFIFLTKRQELIFTEDKVFRITSELNPVTAYLPDRYRLTFSSGVYYIEDPGTDITCMIDRANYARKIGKQNYATQRVVEYTPQMNILNEWNREVTFSMENAIAQGEFEVYYQPQYSFTDSRIIGAEALIRWNKPDKGLLQPDTFIPLFEHNGFIPRIDFFVFESVCKFLDDWNRSGPDGSCPYPITISFNLSRQDFLNPNLTTELHEIRKKYQVEPCKIEVEVTESAVFENQKHLITSMQKIKKAGYDISVDDFGSGYSSLNLLKDMPADVLKLDKEFLSSAAGSEREFSIISSVIDMSKKINLMTIAEGVETKEQAETLRRMGCDIAQGYYYARPISAKAYKELLLQSTAAVAAP